MGVIRPPRHAPRHIQSGEPRSWTQGAGRFRDPRDSAAPGAGAHRSRHLVPAGSQRATRRRSRESPAHSSREAARRDALSTLPSRRHVRSGRAWPVGRAQPRHAVAISDCGLPRGSTRVRCAAIAHEHHGQSGAGEPIPVRFDRPLLLTDIAISKTMVLSVVNVHLRAPLASPIAGQKSAPFVWRTVAGWAEGFFLSALKREAQALELRLLVEQILREDPARLIAVAGDFNAEDYGPTLRLAIASEEDLGASDLAAHSLMCWIARSQPTGAGAFCTMGASRCWTTSSRAARFMGIFARSKCTTKVLATRRWATARAFIPPLPIMPLSLHCSICRMLPEPGDVGPGGPNATTRLVSRTNNDEPHRGAHMRASGKGRIEGCDGRKSGALCRLAIPGRAGDPCAVLSVTQAQQGADEVDTALIVAVDVSNSVDDTRYKLQMEGIAQALEDPGVIQAIVGGAKGGILFSMITWADQAEGQPAVDAHQQRGGGEGRGKGARAAAPGRRVHLHVAHDALRLRQDRAADPGQGGQGRARCLRRRPRQLQRAGAGREGARRACVIRRHRERPADPRGRRGGGRGPGGVPTQSYLPPAGRGGEGKTAAGGLVPRPREGRSGLVRAARERLFRLRPCHPAEVRARGQQPVRGETSEPALARATPRRRGRGFYAVEVAGAVLAAQRQRRAEFTSAWLKFAPATSAPVRSAPASSLPMRLASRRLAPRRRAYSSMTRAMLAFSNERLRGRWSGTRRASAPWTGSSCRRRRRRP